MPWTLRSSRALELALICVAGGVAGVIHSVVFDTSLVVSIIYGLGIGGCVVSYERDFVLPSLRVRVRDLPLPWYVAATGLIYLVLTALGTFLGGLAVLASGLIPISVSDALILTPDAFARALVLTGLIVAVFRARDLIGPAKFSAIFFDRYRHPVRENRILLFLDLVGSSQFARQHGDEVFLAYLTQLFATVAKPVEDHFGRIDDYVGDCAIVSWSVDEGARDARCLRCVFRVFDVLEAGASAWTETFGERPYLRAALHCGSILTAEVGAGQRKITYFGDAINVTSRIEFLAKTLDVDVLASDVLMERLQPLPASMQARKLGRQTIGAESYEVTALTRSGPTPSTSNVGRHRIVDTPKPGVDAAPAP